MKLLHKDLLWEIHFIENQANSLVLEDPQTFTKIMRDFWNQTQGGDGGLILSEDGKELSIAKVVEVVFNPLQLDLNNRKTQTALYKTLADEADGFLQEETIQLRASILTFLDRLSQQTPYPVTYSEDTGINELLRAYGVQIDNTSENLAESIFQYANVMSRMANTELFVFVNLKQYLTRRELQDLYQSLFYAKLNLLDIESEQKYSLDEEKVLLIDKDKCLIEI